MSVTFTCESAVLAKALRDIVAIVPRGHSMEILSNVLIEASDGKVKVTTTNLDMMATRTFAADVSEVASVTVDANRFSSVVASLPTGSVAKVTMGERVTLVAGRSRFSFGSLPAKTYPPMPFDASGVEFEAGEDLLRAMATVRHAVSAEVAAPAYCGICLECADGALNAVSSDGKRLALAGVGNVDTQPFKVTLPTALADMVMKLGEGTDRTILVRIGAQAAQFDFGDTILTGKLLIDVFPNYRRIIPDTALRRITTNGPDMVSALRRVALVIDDAKVRRIHFTIGADGVTIANAGRDEGVEDVPCDVAGEPLTIWFNNQLLREALGALNTQEVVIAINDERGPVKITSPDRENVTMIVMPQF